MHKTTDASLTMPQHSAITMYTTEVCPYCLRAKALLKARGVNAIDEIRVDRDPTARTTMIERTGRRTVPPIFTTISDGMTSCVAIATSAVAVSAMRGTVA